MADSGTMTLGCGSRRHFLRAGAALVALLALPARQLLADAPAKILIVPFSDTGERLPPVELPRVEMTDAQWRAKLSPASYDITREAGTERPFSGALLEEHRKGIFRCICCDTALFSSTTKFDSGTGWPSFWEPIAKENVHEQTDRTLGMARTAVSCALCDAHLGHVFDDGPKPTGLRYCMNSVALQFTPNAAA